MATKTVSGARRRPLAGVIALIALAFAVARFAGGAIPGADGVITACYRKKGGTLRIIDAAGKCRRSEQKITWNERGPMGEAGQQGPPGTPDTSNFYTKSESDDQFQSKCRNGTVGGFAWILGADGSYDLSTIPSTFTSAPALFGYNCSGQPIMVSRSSAGHYNVAFTGNGGTVRLAVANVDVTYGRNDAFANAGIALNTAAGPAVPVVIRDHTGAFVDSPFTIFVLDGLPNGP